MRSDVQRSKAAVRAERAQLTRHQLAFAAQQAERDRLAATQAAKIAELQQRLDMLMDGLEGMKDVVSQARDIVRAKSKALEAAQAEVMRLRALVASPPAKRPRATSQADEPALDISKLMNLGVQLAERLLTRDPTLKRVIDDLQSSRQPADDLRDDGPWQHSPPPTPDATLQTDAQPTDTLPDSVDELPKRSE